MRKIIIILFLLCTSFLNAQVKTIENLGFSKNEITKSDSAKSKEFFKPFSVSAGTGFIYNGNSFLISAAVIAHSNELIHLQLSYSYCKENKAENHMLNLIPQIGINIYGNKYKFYGGIGAVLFGNKNSGYFGLTGDVKIEYNINTWLSINTETLFHPLSQTFNLSFNLPK
ncbi:MAG: hypothetical protein HY959_08000 [Ignavibacteriae bacterium]|nr:hypothetical protein [Ignavibacteriota bacterium]